MFLQLIQGLFGTVLLICIVYANQGQHSHNVAASYRSVSCEREYDLP